MQMVNLKSNPNVIFAAAYAKINLHLEVLGLRTDGFHEVAMVIQSIDLLDEIVFSETNDGLIRLSCDDQNLSIGEDNLILKAAKLDFVSLQNLIPENTSLPPRPKTPSKSKDIDEIATRYLRAQVESLGDIKQQIEYQVSARLGSINVKKIIDEVLKQKSDINIFDAFNALVWKYAANL